MESALWSNETKLELSGHMDVALVWQRKDEAFDPKITVLAVKLGVERLWGSFTASSTGNLVWVHRVMKKGILKDRVKNSAISL